MRILAVDPGSRRVGLAVSDEEGLLASPHSTVERRGHAPTIARVAEIAREVGAVRIVVGLPVRLDGREGPEARRARVFGDALREAAGIELIYLDERYTTSIAERALRDARVRGARRKTVIDQAAAAVLLQGYLDAAPEGGWDARDADEAV